MALLLVGSQVETLLGTATGNADGVFLLTVSLPVDLAEGAYFIRAKTDDHTVDSPYITISGTAPLEEGAEETRTE